MEKKRVTKITVGAVIGVLILIGGGFLIKYLAEKPVHITNLHEISTTLSNSTWKGIENSILGYVDFESEEVSQSEITINPETYNESPNGDVTIATFVVNLDDISRSYAVNYMKIGADSGEYQFEINCPKYIYNKYPETSCIGMNNTSQTIGLYLPQEFTLDTGETVKLIAGYKNGKEAVVIDVNNCGDTSVIDKATRRTKELISSFGLEESAYEYEVPLKYVNCLVK